MGETEIGIHHQRCRPAVSELERSAVAGPVEAIPTCTNVVGVAGSELRTRAMGPVSRLVFSCRLFLRRGGM